MDLPGPAGGGFPPGPRLQRRAITASLQRLVGHLPGASKAPRELGQPVSILGCCAVPLASQTLASEGVQNPLGWAVSPPGTPRLRATISTWKSEASAELRSVSPAGTRVRGDQRFGLHQGPIQSLAAGPRGVTFGGVSDSDTHDPVSKWGRDFHMEISALRMSVRVGHSLDFRPPDSDFHMEISARQHLASLVKRCARVTRIGRFSGGEASKFPYGNRCAEGCGQRGSRDAGARLEGRGGPSGRSVRRGWRA